MAEMTDRSYSAAVYAAFKCIANGLGRTHVGTKNPSYNGCLPLLHSLFPRRAKYINVIRDGRDVAMSTMKMKWGQNSSYACAKVWASYIRLAQAFESTIPAERFLNLRYEDLLTNPKEEIARIESFLAISIGQQEKMNFIADAEQSSLAGNFYKWRTEMSNIEQRHFEAIAGSELEQWNYDRCFDSVTISPFVRGAKEAQELYRKLRHSLR